MVILTNVRTTTLLTAKWDEFDLEQKIWTVPVASLKDRKHRKEPLRIPLAERAIEIMRELNKAPSSKFVFPAQRDRPLSNMAMLTLLKRMNRGSKPRWVDPVSKRPITVHGFRATFRTWAEESTGFPAAVIEKKPCRPAGTQVERAYRRTDVLAKRRELMQAWANWCEPRDGSNIVRLARTSTPD